jgi:hypothetical protein
VTFCMFVLCDTGRFGRVDSVPFSYSGSPAFDNGPGARNLDTFFVFLSDISYKYGSTVNVLHLFQFIFSLIFHAA